jgi:ubiquinone biosynthesis protein UbiJ
MTDATSGFFGDLDRRGEEPLLRNVSGTLRFDVEDDRRVESWFVAVENGEVTVTHDKGEADAVIRADRALVDAIVSGKMNAMAAFLRGAVEVRGDLGLVISFQRLYPGPPPARKKRPAVGRRSTR